MAFFFSQENFVKLVELQRDLVGIDNVVNPNRQFLREGCLQKLSRKGFQQRMFFLVNFLSWFWLMVVCERFQTIQTCFYSSLMFFYTPIELLVHNCNLKFTGSSLCVASWWRRVNPRWAINFASPSMEEIGQIHFMFLNLFVVFTYQILIISLIQGPFSSCKFARRKRQVARRSCSSRPGS